MSPTKRGDMIGLLMLAATVTSPTMGKTMVQGRSLYQMRIGKAIM